MKSGFLFPLAFFCLSLAACGGGGSGDAPQDSLSEVPPPVLDTGGTGSDITDNTGGGTDDGTGGNGGTNDNGNLAWSSSVALSNPLRNASNPALAIDEQGNAVALWVENSTPPSLHAARYNGGDDTWSPPERIDNGAGEVPSSPWRATRYSRSNPQVAIGGGRAFAIWVQRDGDYLSVYASTLGDAGWSTPVALESENNGDAHRARIVADPLGNATAVWVQKRDAIDRDPVVLAAYYSAASASWSRPEQVGAGRPVWDDSVLQLARAGDGRIGLAWLGETDSGERALYYRERTAEGWQARNRLARGDIRSTELAFASGDNRPVLAWSRNTGNYIYRIEVAQRQNGAWQTASVTSEFDTSSLMPTIGVLPEGDLLLAWSRRSPSSLLSIYTSRYIAGSSWQTPVLLHEIGGNYPRMATDAEGNAELLWYGPQTWESRYRAQTGTWTSPHKPFDGGVASGFNLGKEHRVVMNGAGRAIAIWSTESSTDRIRVSVLR